jgi:hypothetical protein
VVNARVFVSLKNFPHMVPGMIFPYPPEPAIKLLVLVLPDFLALRKPL